MNALVAFQDLKSENETRIGQLVSKLKSVTFKSLRLPMDIAEKTERQLHNIAHRNYCCIKTMLNYKTQLCSIPKVSSTISRASRSMKEQSIQLCSSSDVFKKIAVENGSIEICVGDISRLQASLKTIVCFIFNTLLGRYDCHFCLA